MKRIPLFWVLWFPLFLPHSYYETSTPAKGIHSKHWPTSPTEAKWLSFIQFQVTKQMKLMLRPRSPSQSSSRAWQQKDSLPPKPRGWEMEDGHFHISWFLDSTLGQWKQEQPKLRPIKQSQPEDWLPLSLSRSLSQCLSLFFALPPSLSLSLFLSLYVSFKWIPKEKAYLYGWTLLAATNQPLPALMDA
jgi:hypothetical protein